jgi:hypothetical protein
VLALTANQTGPGHWVISGAAVPHAGDSTVENAFRASDSDEHQTRLTVPIQYFLARVVRATGGEAFWMGAAGFEPATSRV